MKEPISVVIDGVEYMPIKPHSTDADPRELRVRRIEFLATETEYAAWTSRAKGLGISLSEYFRKAINKAAF